MTTEALAAVRARSVAIDCAREAYDSAEDVPRLLAEVDRLHTWAGLMSLLDEHWPEDLFPGSYDPSRDDGARIVGLLRWVGNLVGDVESCESRVRSYESVNADLRADRDALAAKLEAALKLRCCVCNASLGYVNHTGLQFCGPCANGETPDPETTREAAQPLASGPETPEGSTSRGTPVPGSYGRSEAVPQTASERIAQIRAGLADLDTVEHGTFGTHGRYRWAFGNPEGRRNMRADLAWLLDHVDRLNTVLDDEQPDVDGWTLHGRVDGGVLLSHDTDADRPTLRLDHGSPVGAVLAFIADQQPEPEWVAYETPCDGCKPASEEGRSDEC